MLPSTALAQLGPASPRSCTVAVNVSAGCAAVVAATVEAGAHTPVAARARTPNGTSACRATVPLVERQLQRGVCSGLPLLMVLIPSRRCLLLKSIGGPGPDRRTNRKRLEEDSAATSGARKGPPERTATCGSARYFDLKKSGRGGAR